MSGWIVPADALRRQKTASDPQGSAWVSAHAGSGKTHVLSQRVVRLLLAGVAPSRILCLTFTKAAAANMAQRVFDTLASWTRLADDDLRREIEKTGARAGDLDEARRLFARAVETPGGLKIQTIHAFCERLLHLFPFEANVSARFEVLTDELRQELLERAKQETLSEAIERPDARLARALRLVASLTSAATFDRLLTDALVFRDTALAAARRQEGETLQMLRDALGAPPIAAADIAAGIVTDGVPESEWETLATLLETGSVNDRKCAARIRQAMVASDDEKAARWLRVFLKDDGAPYKTLITKDLDKATGLGPRLAGEQERLVRARALHHAALAAERSDALATLASEIFGRYARFKQAQGLLDFDDLIERTKSLLSRSDAARWVLYKLDAGFDHILVDEAQDTSEDQWAILERLTDEFFAGEGASRRTRTFFAVGDEKQSIFSFQGADVELFSSRRRLFQRRAQGAGALFEQVRLNLSFRSAKGLLEDVDRVFQHGAHAAGVIDAADGRWMPHEAWKASLPGLVEVWDPVIPPERADPSDWTLPLDRPDDSAPSVILARRIAKVIAQWLAPGSREAVHDRAGGKRPLKAGDVLILVRKRGPFFDAVIRALKDAQVPAAGADRLDLTQHIAVLDLIAAGRAALLPRDDLTLACALKSPLLGLTDDDLLTLAPGRRGSLWRALRDSLDPRHQQAAARIVGWRARAGDTPFRFYARILGAEGGRNALLSRLGPEAADAADEFLRQALESECIGPPSLVTFLHAMENSRQSVKRDMEAASDAVRVMTVHASKGLEAPVVFLPDTFGAPSGRHDPDIVDVVDPRGERLLVWRKGKAGDPDCVARRIEEARTEEEREHRRLLYVALTRAEERLYVCGYHGVQAPKEGCWHAMASAGLAPVLEDAPAPWGGGDRVRRRGAPALLDEAPEPSAMPSDGPELPDWLLRHAPRERAPEPPITPSNALAAADQADGAGGETHDPLTDGDALRIGALIHTLLQHLPDAPPDGRAAAAARFLAARAPDLPMDRREALAERALAVIEDPALATLFGPGSRAEVSLSARLSVSGVEIPVVGQIDRLAASAEAVVIADFKSGASRDAEAVPEAYVAQLALYAAAVAQLWPDRAVRAVLVWTSGPRAVEIPKARLEAALLKIASKHAEGAPAP